MSKPKLAFIGAGNMAKSIIGGLIAEGYPAGQITASGPRAEALEKLGNDLRIAVTTDNTQAVAAAEVVILAVKPQILKNVAQELRMVLTHKPLIISVAAGITTASIDKWLGLDRAIVRSMPNTPSMVQEGATGLYANACTTEAQRALAAEIMGAVGLVQWLEDEALINAVTAVSGSGPAYFFLVMEAMIDAGVELGLSRECASELTVQTALGAALLAKKGNVDVMELRRRVTSPNGTTEQAIKSFENDQIRAMFSRAMRACADRSMVLSQQLGQ